eukprot:2418451-Ditylum_brightwellii.AAC.1
MNKHEESVYHSYFQRTVHAVFRQHMSAKKGMEKYEEIGLAAVVKEFTQLSKGAVPEQNKHVVEPIDADLLTADDKKKALDAVNLIEEKRDGRIKGQTCANGSKQQ